MIDKDDGEVELEVHYHNCYDDEDDDKNDDEVE